MKVTGYIKVSLSCDGFCHYLNMKVKFKEPQQLFYRAENLTLVDSSRSSEDAFCIHCIEVLEDKDRMLRLAKALIERRFARKMNDKRINKKEKQVNALINAMNNSKLQFEFDVEIDE